MLNIKIHQPLGIHEVGKRAKNEDNIFPQLTKANKNQPYFLVCDGVGGAEKGEVASLIACVGYDQFFEEHPTDYPDETYLDEALTFVQSQFDNQLQKAPEHKGMATTMTLLYLHGQGVTVAHIGDSRVYHIRGDEIKFVTYDHSLVNQLLEAGVITEEEAINHPQGNVITRAIQGSQRRTKADVTEINDIQADDYFFLCTDGILESIDNTQLVDILNDNKVSDEEKIEKIISICDVNSRDNFSAYLIKIKAVEGELPAYDVDEIVMEETDYLVGEIEEEETIEGSVEKEKEEEEEQGGLQRFISSISKLFTNS